MPRRNRIDINIGKLYVEMESVYKEVANEQYYCFNAGDENVFFRLYIPILQVINKLINENTDKDTVFVKLDDKIIYFICKDRDYKKYRLYQIKENNSTKDSNFDITNAIDLLSKESIDAIKEAYFVDGFEIASDDYFVDNFKAIAAAIYTTVVKLFQEQFFNFKQIKANIIGFEFTMDCENKRKFNPDEIKFYIQL